MDFKNTDTEGKKEKKSKILEAVPQEGPMGVTADIPVEQGQSIKIGDEVTMTVKGEITEIRKPYGEKESAGKRLNITISRPRTVEVEANTADQSLKQMIGGK
jgi:hypothetical protein